MVLSLEKIQKSTVPTRQEEGDAIESAPLKNEGSEGEVADYNFSGPKRKGCWICRLKR